MSNVIINDTNLTNIANAIRTKNGLTTTYKPREMADAILAIEGSGTGGGNIPTSALRFTADSSYAFANDNWTWFIDQYRNQITTSNLTSTAYMFGSTHGSQAVNIDNIPFALNYSTNSTGGYNCEGMFRNCVELTKLPTMNNCKVVNTKEMLAMCNNLTDISALNSINYSYLHNTDTADVSKMFSNCYSLRQIPTAILQELYIASAAPAGNTIFNNGFNSCYVIDELIGLNPNTGTKVITENMFNNAFAYCTRLKGLTFYRPVVNGYVNDYQLYWSNQTIDLTQYIGYCNAYDLNYIVGYNSGLTEDTRITTATYDELKDNADAWTTAAAYSRYNKVSAFNTIKSLPNVTQGTGNIIKFRGACGESTDGGAINTLSSEEIAVAAAKGWTVSFI